MSEIKHWENYVFQTYVSGSTTNVPQSENEANVRENTSSETDSSAPPTAVRKAPEGKDNESFLHEDVDKESGIFQNMLNSHWLWLSRILW